jgi:hypothetical protein
VWGAGTVASSRCPNCPFRTASNASDLTFKLGDTQYNDATTHLPENTGDQAFDVVVMEPKGKAAKSTKAETPK